MKMKRLKSYMRSFMKKPLSNLAEEMLHTTYFDRSKDLGGEK